MIPLNYHHLYYFFVIAREGSIAKACRKLFLAQPTLSTQLKQFEKAVGRRLFDRDRGRLALSDDGRLVLDYAESIFELGSELEDTLKDRAKAGHPAIQVGVLNGTPRSFAHALIESVLAFDPAAEVRVREAGMEELLDDLRSHRVDVLLTDTVVRGQERDEISSHLVGRVPVVLAAAPAVARRYRSLPRDLDGAPLILPSLPSQVYHQVLDLFAEWGVKPRIVAEVQDVELARRLALAGRGVAVLNAYTVSVSLPKNGLTVLSGSERTPVHESAYLVTRRRKIRNPLAEHLVSRFRLSTRP